MKKNLDELLRTVCAAQNNAEIIAAGLHPTHRARKPLRVAVAAAACAALLTMGARRCGRELNPLSSRTVS